jgi:FlaG/FlaF family flagellin (archaellin)
LRVETGDNVLIAGFIATGTQPKKVIVRAIGPSIPLAGVLADPLLELHNSSGQLIESNNNWRSDHEAEINATGLQPSNDLESAIVATLPANGSAYTAIVRGMDNGTGVGLVEVYDLDRTVDSKLANISTRGLVQTGDNVLIAGTIVLGAAPQKVLVRAMGPSIPVPGALGNPILELRNANGGLIRSNNDWRSDQETEINATGLQPGNDLESAIIETLPGNGAGTTAIVRGVNDTTGVVLVEVYALP